MTSHEKGELDRYYTPTWLAEEVAASMPRNLRGRVLDPTVGTGALLAAVQARFRGRVNLLGIDIDRDVVRTLRRAEPQWTVSQADLLQARARRSTEAWRVARDGVAVVVLNPPFSFRGNGGDYVQFGSFGGRVAPAMHFLVEVLTDLQPAVGIFAILPDGAIDAERHQPLWAAIEEKFKVTRLRRFKTSSFHGARVSTSLVRLKPGKPKPSALEAPFFEKYEVEGCRCVEVIRGRVPVHTVRGLNPLDATLFLHTTNLRSVSNELIAPTSLSDEGPLVIITRVGRWSDPLVLEIGKAVLSDCLIAVRPRSRSQLEALAGSLRQAAPRFSDEYRGTGAQYLTLSSVKRQLEALGWHPTVVKASSSAGECCCDEAMVPDVLRRSSND